jgi:hypothetical protein
MPSVGFEPSIAGTKLPQTYALDRASTVIGHMLKYDFLNEMYTNYCELGLRILICFYSGLYLI